MTENAQTHKPSFPRGHVTSAARALGVSQGHLWHVLHGKRVSVRLMKRYRKFVAKQKAAISA